MLTYVDMLEEDEGRRSSKYQQTGQMARGMGNGMIGSNDGGLI